MAENLESEKEEKQNKTTGLALKDNQLLICLVFSFLIFKKVISSFLSSLLRTGFL